jgi:hypothetical protein
VKGALLGALALAALAPVPVRVASLVDALPSPRPAATMPSMPPMALGKKLFHEDFEAGMATFRAEGTRKGLGWHRLRAAACGGRYTMVLGRAFNDVFTDATTTADLVLVKPLDLTRARHPRLQYDLKGITYPPERVEVRPWVRRPGGQWQPIGAVGQARYMFVATFTADLTAYRGGKLDLRFRGEIKAGSKPNKGMYLDDITVVEPR